jgi:hypothetical protein
MNASFDSGFFPGFLDPDGRPWLRVTKQVSTYQRGLESAIKIALLTQNYLVIPAGYLLDNPILQRIFIEHGGSDTEAVCFKKLMIDLIRVSAGKSSTKNKIDSTCDWRELLTAWINGENSGRGQQVYLSCLDHEHAIEAQDSSTAEQLQRRMRQGLLSRWRVDLDQVLNLYRGLPFHSVPGDSSNFDQLVRSRLLSREEKFDGFDDLMVDKLSAVAEAVARHNNMRLSRSLLRNKSLCIDAGVSEKMTLSLAEYNSLAPILAHYHQLSFAQSIGLESFVSYQMPTLESVAKSLLERQLQSLSVYRVANEQISIKAWPLEIISFEDIYKVRLGRHRTTFTKNLNRMHDAALNSSTEITAYQEALEEHLLYVAQIISFSFREISNKELTKALEGLIFAEEATAAGILDVAKYCLTFMPQFAQNIRKDLSIRMTLRKLANNLNCDSITS